MAKNSVFDWDATAANNTDVGGVGITGNNLPSNLDDAMRTLMAQVKAFQTYLGITSTGNIWTEPLVVQDPVTATQFIASGSTGQFRTTSDFLDIDPVGATTTQALVRLFRAVNTTNNNPQLVLYNADGTSSNWLIMSRQGGINLSSGVFTGNGSGLTGMSSSQVVPPGRDSIGAYGLLRNVSGSSVTSGATVAGADLRYISIQNPGATGASPAGTWRNHSNTLANSESGLFVRTI